MTIAIKFDNVSKKFNLERERPRSFQEIFVRPFQKKQKKEPYWVLKNASFEIEAGESVALIGPNGAGKSTLLKMISQIIMPTSGQIEINGRISSLLELGSGFHPDLSGRENVYLNGSLIGLSRAEVDEKFQAIVEFAEMEKFIDLQVKHYSSGMYLRLAFAIASYVEPDILLIDEAIAVGDQTFQDRCYKRLATLKEAGVTIILVSHSIGTVKEYSERGIWLQDGQIQADGDIERVSEAYIANLYQRDHAKQLAQLQQTKETDTVNRWGSREVEITSVEFLNAPGETQPIFLVGDTLILRMHYYAAQPVEGPVFGIAIYKADGTHINGPNTKLADDPIPAICGKGYVDYTVKALNLLPGAYEVSAAVYDTDMVQAYDHHHRYYKFQVRQGEVKETFGTIYLPSQWKHILKQDIHQPVQSAVAEVDSVH